MDSKIQKLYSQLEIETKCRDGALYMLQKLSDKNAKQQCEQNLQDSEDRLDLLRREMQKVASLI
jgi:hypothetical protein